jgi:hypothetical protein
MLIAPLTQDDLHSLSAIVFSIGYFLDTDKTPLLMYAALAAAGLCHALGASVFFFTCTYGKKSVLCKGH